jgi:hypothetical protein
MERLNYIKFNQPKLRVESYRGFMEAITDIAGCIDLTKIGTSTILPSTFTGGPRQQQQLYQDSMSIVIEHGKPDLLLTMTCNPKSPSLLAELKHGQIPCDRPDLITRDFENYRQVVMWLLVKKDIFGKIKAFVWVRENQKRGLPHMHLIIFLDKENKLSLTQLDNIISARVPDPVLHPQLYKTISTCSYRIQY